MKKNFLRYAPLGFLFLIACLQLVRGGVFYERWIEDIFIPFEGVKHLQYNQWPHRDFSTPVGALYYLIYYIPTLISPLSAKTIVYANILVAIVVCLSVQILAVRRLPNWVAALTALYVGMVALSPRQLGSLFNDVTYNAAYNRHCWAVIAVLALLVAIPARGGGRRQIVADGVGAGILLLFLFFIKLTYFVVGAGLFLLASLTIRRSSATPFVVSATVVVVAAVAGIQASTGMIAAYMVDVRLAMAVMPDPLRIWQGLALLNYSAPGCVLVVALCLLPRRREQSLNRLLKVAIPAVATALAGVVIGIQNHPALENPLMPIAALIACFGGRRDESESNGGASDDAAAARGVVWAASAGIAGMLLIPIAQDVAASAWTARARSLTGQPVAWLGNTALWDLRVNSKRPDSVAAASSQTLTSEADFIEVLGDGVALLRGHMPAGASATVLSLTWSNPFPVLLDLPPVRHELAWWHEGRTFTIQIKPPGAKLLAAVDYVMIPERYNDYGATEAMKTAYAVELERDFRPAGQTANWTLLARRDCQLSGRC